MTEFSDGAPGIDSAQREKAAYESNGKTTNDNMSFMTFGMSCYRPNDNFVNISQLLNVAQHCATSTTRLYFNY